MTKQCSSPKEFTEFSLWLRDQKEISSEKGYVTTDVDYIWKNYKKEKWMILEEKRRLKKCVFPQTLIWEKLVDAIEDSKFLGFHLITFEKTNPDEGDIYLDYKKITKKDLIEFLQFEKEMNWYKTLKPYSYDGKKDYVPQEYSNWIHDSDGGKKEEMGENNTNDTLEKLEDFM